MEEFGSQPHHALLFDEYFLLNINNLARPKMLGNYQRRAQSKHEIFLKYSLKMSYSERLDCHCGQAGLIAVPPPCHGVLFLMMSSRRGLEGTDVSNSYYENLHNTLQCCPVAGSAASVVPEVSSSWVL